MATTLGNTNLTFNDGTTCKSGKAVAKAWAHNVNYSNFSIGNSYNISSATFSGATFTITMTSGAVTDTNYAVFPIPFPMGTGSNPRTIYHRNTNTLTTFTMTCQWGATGSAMVNTVFNCSFIVYGNAGA